MVTPNRKAIIEKAIQIWKEDRFKKGQPYELNPEIEELKEEGFLNQAQSELMRDNHKAEIESEYVDYPNEFSININELMKGNALILGSRGIGKSDVGMRIIDKAMSNGMICVAFDPSQDWQNRSSIPHFQILKTAYIDKIPIKSVVYDISLLSPREHQQVVESFCGMLFRHQAETSNRKKYVVVFEEAHTYFPQGCMRAKAYQNTVKLLSVGRNLDVCCVLISQFSSMLDKFAIKHSVSQTYSGFTKEYNDLKYLRSLLGSEVEQLAKLNDGEFLYVTRDGTQKIAIQPFENTIPKTQIFAKIPELEPINPIQTQDTSKVIVSLATFLISVFLMILAISSMPSGVI